LNLFPKIDISSSLFAFVAGLRLDLSTISYFIAPAFILWSFYQFFSLPIFYIIHLIYNATLIFTVTLLSIANLRLYKEWGTLVGHRAIIYLQYPKQVFASESTFNLLILFLSIFIVSILLFLVFKCTTKNFVYVYKNVVKRVAFVIITPIVLFVLIRGGFQHTPINESSTYYSVHTANNHLATNHVWYFIHSLLDAGDTKNAYVFMRNEEAETTVAQLMSHQKDTSVIQLKSKKPNVVFIILESWTADAIESLGGLKNVTPYFNELQKDGILFTNCYASGYRTDQGLISILSGFPAQPDRSIITTPGKSEKLPCIATELSEKGYPLSFYYGGESEYANMKTFLLSKRFEKIIDKKDFTNNEQTTDWGILDEYVFDKAINVLKDEKEPFFSTILTLSSHEPFDIPFQTPFKGSSIEEKCKSAIWYTDKCLRHFFDKAKQSHWYSNTLFVLVADHGHRLPLNRNMNEPEAKKIPLLILGDILPTAYKGKHISNIVSQHDIPAIILSMLNIPSQKFIFSKNALQPLYKGFAYYSNENVLGWITNSDTLIYSFTDTKMLKGKSTSPEIKQAKAYLQILYKAYLDY